jgi:serpin B
MKEKGFAAVELPYAGDELSMQVFLPDSESGLDAVEKELTADNLAKWTFRNQEVQLTLPKFKMTQEFKLNDQLKQLGMPLAFSDKADLSGIGGSPGELYVSSVLHKSFIDVNEEGTEAAAATGIIVGTTAVAVPKPPVIFKADHPFVFVIRHKPTGEVLFIGRVVDPDTKDAGN